MRNAAVRRDDFDMARDFDARLRGLVSAAALERTSPVVDCPAPAVEGALVRGDAGRRAVVLMNWTYRAAGRGAGAGPPSRSAEPVPFTGLKVSVRGAGEVRRVRSIALGCDLPLEGGSDKFAVTLPSLDEGDVLLLE